MTPRQSACSRAWFVFLSAGAFALLAIAAWGVPLNQDEGWYLLAARRFSEGLYPWHDFTFTQGPVSPRLFAPALPLVDAFGLHGARLFQAFLATAAFACVVAALPQDKRVPGGALAFCLLMLQPHFLQFSVTVKTYALTGCFLAAAGHAWFRPTTANTSANTALWLALAAATRISAGILFLPLGLSLFNRRASLGHRPWIAFGLAGAAMLALFFLPALLRDPQTVWFNLVGFHTARQVDTPWLARAGFLLRTLHAWLPLVLAGLWFAFHPRQLGCKTRALLAGTGLVTLVHLLSPFPYDEYQAVLTPWVALLVTRELTARTLSPKTLVFICAACGIHALSSPFLHTWSGGGQDRIWWQAAPETDLAQLRRVARELREQLEPGAVLFTPDAYLAVEAGLDVPRGMEMGPFSLSPAPARPGLLDWEGIEHALNQSHAAAFSGYLFIRSPEIRPFTREEEERLRAMIEARFEHQHTVPNFGQGKTDLEIWW